MLDADMLGRGVAEDILTAAEVRHGHTIAMIAFEGAALGLIQPVWVRHRDG
jgi:hypothetical protein